MFTTGYMLDTLYILALIEIFLERIVCILKEVCDYVI